MRRGLPPVAERTLIGAYERVLARTPDAQAQADETGSVTFAGSFERSLRLAAGFAAHGIGPRQPAALLLDNSLDAVHAWSGLGLGGMVEVPVNTAYKERFLAHVLNDSGAELIVIEDGYAGRLAAYMYTSGTTGASKGVLISHAHAYTYASREHQERPRDGDRILVTLPVFHLAGQWYGVYQALIHGLPSFVAPGFSVRRYWDTVRARGSTVTVMLGAMAELLQQQPLRPDDADNPLDLAVMAPLASDVTGFCRRFGLRAAAVYGMSEIGAVLDGPPETVVGGEAGFPREEYQLRVVDSRGGDVAAGEIGELWVRPQDPRLVMAGYHNLPDKTAETLVDGWVHTGDAFRVDTEGRFFFADRMKDALRRRGENVSSFEVERVINEYPAVFESAVVGVPAELTEDEIKAVVVVREGQHVDPVELTRFLIDRLPYFMVPRYLEFAAELPKTPTQKVRKHLLRERGTGPEVWDREAAGIVLRRGSR